MAPFPSNNNSVVGQLNSERIYEVIVAPKNANQKFEVQVLTRKSLTQFPLPRILANVCTSGGKIALSESISTVPLTDYGRPDRK